MRHAAVMAILKCNFLIRRRLAENLQNDQRRTSAVLVELYLTCSVVLCLAKGHPKILH